MFDHVLIANRGEIACRVIHTCRRLGIATVAVHSDVDAGARHVALADQAVAIGPAPARDSYLRGEAVIAAARATGAQAIHPGYGFLSENAGFAEAVTAAGLTFIGPPAAAIRAMGSKSAAKALMAVAGVPLVPGCHDDNQDADFLASEAGRIGFPLLIKASAGGGGKGMRVVTAAAGFADALAAVRREAAAAFGDDRVLLERYLPRARHVEVQVFADAHGTTLHLHERDCSIQRRHQKVVEEAPAPGLAPAMRAAMGRAAVAAAEAVGYRGAGTVEFIVAVGDDGAPEAFFFMEMNTRLQVEHPVTEAITGLDLVEWQLRVAAGAPLPLRQQDVPLTGHAIEARLYAEDPARGFLPSTGRLALLALPGGREGPAEKMDAPADAPAVRVDSGVRTGDDVTSHYDPMLAKIIVHGATRPAAVWALRRALADTAVAGPESNRDSLAAIAADPDFLAGRVDTGFLARPPRSADGVAIAGSQDESASIDGGGLPSGLDPRTLALFCLGELLRMQAVAARLAAASADPYSPWHRRDGWRLNDDRGCTTLSWAPLAAAADRIDVAVRFLSPGPDEEPRFDVMLPDGSMPDGSMMVGGGLAGTTLTATVTGARRTLRIAAWTDGQGRACRMLADDRRSWRLQRIDPLQRMASRDGCGGGVQAPMPGKVAAVHVKAGDVVRRGDPLVVIDAMKMEHILTAPGSGAVAAVRCAVGDQVTEGTALVSVAVSS